ncbi:hypothetical protein FQN55_005816 [Onygenales sp. PD_40]|nr:hypothetical protein FQN55_005816 [Onygenales sp. PD_40]
MSIPAGIVFQRALDKIKSQLSEEEKAEFTNTKLEDVRQAAYRIQLEHGGPKEMKTMIRIQGFLEAMEQYGKVIEVFLNSSIMVGFIWGPIKFVLLIAGTWAESLDTLLGAYEDIADRLPSFQEYETLFEKHKPTREALELYYCDILEFHVHAIAFFKKQKWKKLFHCSWKTFNTQFRPILNSLSRRKELLDSQKGTVVFHEIQRLHEDASLESKKISQEEARKRLETAMSKINAPNSQADHKAALEQRGKSESGKWILENLNFKAWSAASVSMPLLYINAIPGAGKTILASFVIETLLAQPQIPVLFFYCKHQEPDKRTHTDILRGLLAQLLPKDKTVVAWFVEEYARYDQGRLILAKVLEDAMEFALNSQRHVYIILDGLDECKPKEAAKTIKWLLAYQEASQGATGKISLLCLGQRTDELQTLLSSAASIVLDTVGAHGKDIECYVQLMLDRVRSKFKIDSLTSARIMSQVLSSSRGMFLYAKLVMENLLSQYTLRDFMAEIQPGVFPQGLEAAYERIVSAVFESPPERQRQIASKILGSVICVERPLRWREIQATFFIDPEHNSASYEEDRLLENCKLFCSSLVDVNTIPDKPNTEALVVLVHDTAREYLTRMGLMNLSLEHSKMAIFCTRYLLSEPFKARIGSTEIEQYFDSGYYAFLDYATQNVFGHLFATIQSPTCTDGRPSETLLGLTKSFLDDYGIRSEPVRDFVDGTGPDDQLHDLTVTIRSLPQNKTELSKLFSLESRAFQIRKTIETYMAHRRKDVVLLETMYGPLSYKCPRNWCRHFNEGFDTKLDRDSHIEKHERRFQCSHEHCPHNQLGFPSHAALKQHDKQSHAADGNAGFLFKRPRKFTEDDVREAATRGDVAALRHFLKTTSYDTKHRTKKERGIRILMLAAYNGHLDACKLLLDSGVDVNGNIWAREADPMGNSPMTAAIHGNRVEIVQFLLQVERFIPPRNSTYLWHAAKKGHLEIFKIFFEIFKRENKSWATSDAVTHLFGSEGLENHVRIAQILLDDGIDPDKLELLPYTARKGYLQKFRMLLDDFKRRKGQGWETHSLIGRSIEDATEHDHHEIIQLLLDEGIIPDYPELLPLAARSHPQTFMRLLDGFKKHQGEDWSSSNPVQRAMEIATEIGLYKIIQGSLLGGIILDHPNLLPLAAENGHLQTFMTLLDDFKKGHQGEDWSASDPIQRAMEIATDHGYYEIIQTLLNSGIIPDHPKLLPLAAGKHSLQTFTTLFDDFKTGYQGEDWSPSDPIQRAMEIATDHGFYEIIQTLLDSGITLDHPKLLPLAAEKRAEEHHLQTFMTLLDDFKKGQGEDWSASDTAQRAMEISMEYRHYEFIQFLLGPNDTDLGRDHIPLAKEKGCPQILKNLIGYFAGGKEEGWLMNTAIPFAMAFATHHGHHEDLCFLLNIEGTKPSYELLQWATVYASSLVFKTLLDDSRRREKDDQSFSNILRDLFSIAQFSRQSEIIQLIGNDPTTYTYFPPDPTSSIDLPFNYPSDGFVAETPSDSFNYSPMAPPAPTLKLPPELSPILRGE